MSASEKLRALEPRGRAALKAPLTQAGRWEEEMILADFLDALPLIADLVEAAEALEVLEVEDSDGWIYRCVENWSDDPLNGALVALNNALEQADGAW